MGNLTKGAVIAGVLLAGLGGTVAVRTALFKGPAAADLDQVKLVRGTDHWKERQCWPGFWVKILLFSSFAINDYKKCNTNKK